jgi:hypothetical protein
MFLCLGARRISGAEAGVEHDFEFAYRNIKPSGARLVGMFAVLHDEVKPDADLARPFDGRRFRCGRAGPLTESSISQKYSHVLRGLLRAVNDLRKIAGSEAYAPTDNVAELHDEVKTGFGPGAAFRWPTLSLRSRWPANRVQHFANTVTYCAVYCVR